MIVVLQSQASHLHLLYFLCPKAHVFVCLLQRNSGVPHEGNLLSRILLTSTDLIFSWWARVKIDHKTQESEESEESEEERLSWNFGLRPSSHWWAFGRSPFRGSSQPTAGQAFECVHPGWTVGDWLEIGQPGNSSKCPVQRRSMTFACTVL